MIVINEKRENWEERWDEKFWRVKRNKCGDDENI